MNNQTQIFDLRNLSAVVTGGGGHLGLSICRGIVQHGIKRLFILGRTISKLEQTKLECQQIRSDVEIEPISVNLADSKDVEKVLNVLSTRGDIHIVVNNAYSGGSGNLSMSTAEQFSQSYQIGMVAIHQLTTGLLPQLRQSYLTTKRTSSVINIGSMYGIVSPDHRIYESTGNYNPPFYGAVKAAVTQWGRYAACELASQGIRVNTIAPGPFPKESFVNDFPKVAAGILQKIPFGRFGRPDELIGPVVFLASEASSYVTGTTLMVDGGWTAW